jgi:hypothetical protein
MYLKVLTITTYLSKHVTVLSFANTQQIFLLLMSVVCLVMWTKTTGSSMWQLLSGSCIVAISVADRRVWILRGKRFFKAWHFRWTCRMHNEGNESGNVQRLLCRSWQQLHVAAETCSFCHDHYNNIVHWRVVFLLLRTKTVLATIHICLTSTWTGVHLTHPLLAQLFTKLPAFYLTGNFITTSIFPSSRQ